MSLKRDFRETHHLRAGHAGVLRVASELLLRDVDVFLPAVDCAGVDLIVAGGTRIQVKTARLRRNKQYRHGLSYGFTFGFAQRGNHHTVIRRAKSYSSQIDYMILWGINEDRFWIAPAALFDRHYLLILGEGRTQSLIKLSTVREFAAVVYAHENRWDLLLPPPASSRVLAIVDSDTSCTALRAVGSDPGA